MNCEKCKSSPSRHRYHFGYIAVECPGQDNRWLRYWHLCTECLENAKIRNEGRQHPLWYFRTYPKCDENGEQITVNGQKQWENKLELSDKTVWPDDVKGRTYGNSLRHPSAAKNAIDDF